MNNHAFLLRRLVTAILASVAGVLATAVLWKPGVLAGAVIVPVITELVQLTFLRSAPMTPRSRTTPWFERVAPIRAPDGRRVRTRRRSDRWQPLHAPAARQR